MKSKRKIKPLTYAQMQMFFIFSEKMRGFFIHLKPGSKYDDEKQEFILKKGAAGACLFDDQNSFNMLKQRPGLNRIKAADAKHLF
jgi:hypothetical protein